MGSLAPERDALWKRLEAASFLTTNEKRAAAGYDASADSASPQLKYREDQPRVPAGNPDGGRWTDGGSGGGTSDGRVRVAQARGGRDRPSILARFPEATPAQEARWAISNDWARDAISSVRRLDPNWRPTPEISESIEGEIRVNEAQAREAEARLRQLSTIPNTNPNWGVNRLRKELSGQGFRFADPTDAEGYLYRNDADAEVRIMRRPQKQYRTDPIDKHENEYYYRYKAGPGKGWGQHITIPDKPIRQKSVEEIAYE